MGIINCKPDAWQIEVVLLGPGYGESILIHIGDHRWIIIDSCIAAGSNHKKAAALEYFESIDVDPAECVEMIIATHWHDDHIRGLSELVECCPNASFVCSAAFTKKEFLTYLKRFTKRNNHVGSSGVREMHKIFSTISNRKKILGLEQRRLLSIAAEDISHGHKVDVWSLSPSDEQVQNFLDEIGEMIPSEKQTIRRATTASGQNHSALVNLIHIGDIGILLGSDLENQPNSNSGWDNVSSSYASDFPKSIIFKIPHHGSDTAFNHGVWQKMIGANAYAILTPWNRGKGLPTQAGIKNIKKKTPNAYITTVPNKLKTTVKRESTVEKMIKQSTLNGEIRLLNPPYGTIQVRAKDPNFTGWDVHLSQHAVNL